MSENKLVLKTINELLGENFYIPSYQRGYRWGKIQVTQLLDDIWEFRTNAENKSKNSFYCLQPIVVRSKEWKNESEVEITGWEVIDGQQRLTTLLIILDYLKDLLKYLEKEKFSIKYQTRKNSEVFLNDIDVTQNNDNIDYYFFCEARTAVENWFKIKNGTAKINFLTTLLNDNKTYKGKLIGADPLTDLALIKFKYK